MEEGDFKVEQDLLRQGLVGVRVSLRFLRPLLNASTKIPAAS